MCKPRPSLRCLPYRHKHEVAGVWRERIEEAPYLSRPLRRRRAREDDREVPARRARQPIQTPSLGKSVQRVAIAPNNSFTLLHLLFKGGVVWRQLVGAARTFNQKKAIAFVCLQPVDSFLRQHHA